MCVDVRQKISERNFNRNAFARAPSSSFLKRRLSLSLSRARAQNRRSGFREDLNDDDVNDDERLLSRGGSNARLFLSIKKYLSPQTNKKRS